jgi:hypothetical protein
MAGLKRAVANGSVLGRPLNNPGALETAKAMLAKGVGINKTAGVVGLGTGTVHKLKREMAASAAKQTELGSSVARPAR